MISDKEYKKLLKQFHKLSYRHILFVETDMPASDVQKVVILSDKIRKAGNELVSLMRKNYDQLMRTKKYRKLLKLYGSTIVIKTFFNTTPNIFSFCKGKYGINTIFLTYMYHSVSTMIPCDIVLFLHFIELIC